MPNIQYRALVVLLLLATCGVIAFTLAALISGEWRYLAGTLVCLAIVRPLFK